MACVPRIPAGPAAAEVAAAPVEVAEVPGSAGLWLALRAGPAYDPEGFEGGAVYAARAVAVAHGASLDVGPEIVVWHAPTGCAALAEDVASRAARGGADGAPPEPYAARLPPGAFVDRWVFGGRPDGRLPVREGLGPAIVAQGAEAVVHTRWVRVGAAAAAGQGCDRDRVQAALEGLPGRLPGPSSGEPVWMRPREVGGTAVGVHDEGAPVWLALAHALPGGVPSPARWVGFRALGEVLGEAVTAEPIGLRAPDDAWFSPASARREGRATVWVGPLAPAAAAPRLAEVRQRLGEALGAPLPVGAVVRAREALAAELAARDPGEVALGVALHGWPHADAWVAALRAVTAEQATEALHAALVPERLALVAVGDVGPLAEAVSAGSVPGWAELAITEVARARR
jgi:hypothetical protein